MPFSGGAGAGPVPSGSTISSTGVISRAKRSPSGVKARPCPGPAARITVPTSVSRCLTCWGAWRAWSTWRIRAPASRAGHSSASATSGPAACTELTAAPRPCSPTGRSRRASAWPVPADSRRSGARRTWRTSNNPGGAAAPGHSEPRARDPQPSRDRPARREAAGGPRCRQPSAATPPARKVSRSVPAIAPVQGNRSLLAYRTISEQQPAPLYPSSRNLKERRQEIRLPHCLNFGQTPSSPPHRTSAARRGTIHAQGLPADQSEPALTDKWRYIK